MTARVLLINDDPVQLHLLATLLEQDRHQVQRCQSAEEAYDLLQNRLSVDVIVSDLHLPGMDGWRFCRLIRSSSDKELNTLPILVVSATYSDFDADQIKRDLQVHEFLPLPIEPQRFRDCVRQLVDGTIKPATLRVLLVEENDHEAGRLQECLKELGWLVCVSRSGEDAKGLVQRQHFDIVIANQVLPDRTGLDLLCELKQWGPSLVRVLLASDSNSPSRREAWRRGIEAWFCKPYDPSHVVTVCQKVRQEQAVTRVEALLETRTNSLRDSEAQFRTLFESLPDVLIVYDHAQVIRHINRSGAQQLGYSNGELVGQSIQVISPPAQPGSLSWYSNGSGPALGEWRETRIVAQNGTMIDVEIMERSVTYQGEPGTLIVARDMTSRKRMEKEKEMLEDQLRQAQKMEAIGRLAAGVAHDVNNILAAILGHASLLKARSGSNSQLWQTGDVIDKAVRRGRQLTSQLLGFARQGKHQHVNVDVHGVIQEVIALLSRTVDKSIALDYSLEASQNWVMGDPNQIYQVLMNLALNACDAMPEGGTLEFSTTNEWIDQETARRLPGLTQGATLTVAVKDSGNGIPQDIKHKIFEPFFTTKEKGKGSGMGLAMAYGIVKNHHGYIEVSSERDQGTTMKVYWPCTMHNGENKKSTAAEAPMHGHEHILVVDDDEVVAHVAAELLEHLGYHVATVTGGHQAVEYCRQHKGAVHLVLLDMIMDGMNGTECFAAIQEVDPHLKVIMCTGYDRNHAVHELLNHGVAGFIQKPYDISELSQVVREVLEGTPHAGTNLTLTGKSAIDKEYPASALAGRIVP